MPERLLSPPKKFGRPDWNRRYVALESRRADLLARLAKAVCLRGGDRLQHTATSLLNEKFRAAKIAQRGSILASAEWLVGLLETGRHAMAAPYQGTDRKQRGGLKFND